MPHGLWSQTGRRQPRACSTSSSIHTGTATSNSGTQNKGKKYRGCDYTITPGWDIFECYPRKEKRINSQGCKAVVNVHKYFQIRHTECSELVKLTGHVKGCDWIADGFFSFISFVKASFSG